MDLKNIMLTEKKKTQSQKVTLNIFLNLQNYGEGKKISGCQELEVALVWQLTGSLREIFVLTE